MLCIWQLETGKKQDLPHLPAPIDDLVVSPKGASYAIRLADNSIMVLSTSELKPTANIAGIQTQYISVTADIERQLVEKVDTRTQSDNPYDAIRRTPAALNPIDPTQLLMAVPSSISRTEVNATHLPTPYLQTFDFLQARHISRQAITRNNATTFMNNPNAQRIQEPNVRFIEVSHDGKWLATVEEWMPPKADVKILSPDNAGVADERSLRMETYLKFWSWNDKLHGGVWQLETRIDTPHLFSDALTPGRIFGLTSEPNGDGFATIGEDGFARIWKPKTRLRDGVIVRGASGKGLVSWSAQHIVELDNHPSASDLEFDFPSIPRSVHGTVAYSEDGSLLVASLAQPESSVAPVVHFINTITGEVKQRKTGLYSNGLVAMGIVDRHLIILSDSLNVWDIVSNEHVYGFTIHPPQARLTTPRIESNHLAVNRSERSFAVSLITKRKGKAANSKVQIFTLDKPNPILSTKISSPVTALIAIPRARGFTAITSTAEVYVLGPSGGSLILPSLVNTVSAQRAAAAAAAGLTEGVGLAADALGEGADATTTEALIAALVSHEDTDADGMDIDGDNEEPGNDKPVVRPQQLAQVFDAGPGFALPPVRQLFDAVVRLYARKPRTAEVVA